MNAKHLTTLLFTLYYISFAWICLILLAGLLILIIAGVEPFIAFRALYMYKWYNYLAFLFILLRFAGAIFVRNKRL